MSFASTIVQWFYENGRSLPWRETRDPYAVWLSEIILQQTRIGQGRPYWERFMRRWPTVADLAAASEDDVLREWQGLGYYSRARNLHEAARQVVAQGAFPTTVRGLRSLKGVGDYTAAAIGSIAYGLPVAVVDGNVYRVLARHYGIATPINTTEGRKEFAALAQELLQDLPETVKPIASVSPIGPPGPVNAFSAYNQGMMDFGAIQCTPVNPRCPGCPLAESCVALREGRVGELPVKLRTLKVKERHLIYIYIRCQGQTAIRRRPPGDIWQGLYEPLCLEVRGERLEVRGERLEVREMLQASGILSPLTSNLSPLKKGVRHVLTHRVIYADFWLWEPEERPALPDGYFWIDEKDIDNYGVPRLIEILLEAL